MAAGLFMNVPFRDSMPYMTRQKKERKTGLKPATLSLEG